jgi:hypothetical protein
MKKNLMFAMIGAIALTGAVGFSSCSQSEDVAEVNPNYNPETNEVITQFVFNVATGNTSSSAGTRMTEAVTQAKSTNDFRGIDNAHVMCFIQQDADGLTDGKSLATATTAAKDFDMARVAAPKSLSSNDSRRVLEMSLPLKTNTILFYGKAIQGDNYTKNSHGSVTYTVDKDLSKVNFSLEQRLATANKDKFQHVETLIADVLSCIMNVSRGTASVAATDSPQDTESEEAETAVKPYGFALEGGENAYGKDIKWASYKLTGDADQKSPVDNTMNLTPLEIKLGQVYKELTSIQNAELRNGSGYGIIKTVEALWSIVNSVRCAEPTSKPEALAKYMAHLISEEISLYFSKTINNSGASVENVAFKDASTMITMLTSDAYWPGTTKPTAASFSDINGFSSSDLADFPEADPFNLPQGAAHYHFNTSTKLFEYAWNFNSSAAGGGSFTPYSYMYPPELLYFGNSSIRTSNAEHTVGAYPHTTTDWDNWAVAEADQDTWEADKHVETSTRSVAMKNNINYGTSLLKTSVQYYSEDTEEGKFVLLDNNKVIQKRDYKIEENNKTIIVDASSFELKGILIGGQADVVGWDYIPTASSTQRYVYDNTVTATIPASGYSSPNYTLVFDNYKPGNTQDKVYIALELVNKTNQSFFGRDNMIQEGGTFYLIGELDPTNAASTITWPTKYALPPYDANGATIQTKRVFIQDYMTTAQFTIGKYSLQYAYLTVPDLRSNSLTLGLSVDLSWQTGLTFSDVILGGNTQTPIPTN